MASLDAIYQKSEDMVSRKVAGEYILVPVRRRVADLESIYNLNEVGGFIYERIDGATPASQILEAICREFDVSREQAEADLVQFLSTLKEIGAVTEA
ncbi:MAG: PqqD family protein [Armatimonadota bacterium]